MKVLNELKARKKYSKFRPTNSEAYKAFRKQQKENCRGLFTTTVPMLQGFSMTQGSIHFLGD